MYGYSCKDHSSEYKCQYLIQVMEPELDSNNFWPFLHASIHSIIQKSNNSMIESVALPHFPYEDKISAALAKSLGAVKIWH